MASNTSIPFVSAAAWLSIPYLHGDSRMKDPTSTVSLRHWNAATWLVSNKAGFMLFPSDLV